MLKLTGALILIAVGTFTGYMESHRLAMRVQQLEAFLRFLSTACTEIRFSALPVEEIVLRYGGEMEFLKICGETCKSGGNFLSAWDAGLSACTKDRGFLAGDVGLLHGFGQGFGSSDTDGQLSHCALYSELVTEKLKDAREEKNRKSKLYQILGIFSGIAAALLLC